MGFTSLPSATRHCLRQRALHRRTWARIYSAGGF
uniref:Uncharacterized protein n=1 Tax=Myoviridae sp. ctIyl4 TaxID=2825078 RepID=A0A8S5PMI2_9CAUD|nr:MAG TPA: hypothetical protein [Myoviridae sp. ctIyl4]